MTIYDKGLLRAMKAAYKDSGYIVAVTEDSVIIQTTFWGVEIVKAAVPNSIKGLIVVHNGEMPRQDTAVNIQKAECSSVILDTALATMDELAKKFTATGGIPIKPTRLTFDGMRVWQTTTDLNLRLVEVDDQQILSGEKWDANLVGRYIYGRNWFGSMYVLPQMGLPEDKPLFLDLSKPLIPVSGSLDETSLRRVEHISLDGNYLNLLQQDINELRETSGNTETATGTTNSGVTAASAIAALQEASGKGSVDSNMGSYRAHGEICTLVVELMRQFYDLPRKFRILGQYGTKKYISYTNTGLQPQAQSFLGQNMGFRKPVFDIEITAQKKNVFTTVSQNELALQFFNLGFFNPQMAEPALLCLEMMEFDSKDTIMQKIAENAQLWQKLQMYMQMALNFAQQLDPMMAQTIAMDITKTLGAAPLAGPADTKAPQLVQADNITGLQKKEHAVVANARERAGSAGTPGGDMNKETEQQPQTRMKWEEIVKDPEYNAEIQKIVKARVKDDGESKAILEILSPALQHLAKENGLDPQNMDYTALVKHITGEYDNKALELGVSKETAMKLDQQQRTAEQMKFQNHISKLEQQGEALKAVFPNFDLRTEMQNPVFARLTSPSVGLSVEDAFHAVHRKEIQAQSMQVAAQKTQEMISNAIQSGTHRPDETGTAAQAPSVSQFDYRTATPAQRKALKEEIRRAAARGEKIYPGRF